MKALLICPAARPGLAALTARATPALLPILGGTLLEYWLVHLAARGAREVIVLAPDRPEDVQREAGGGARWGLTVEVVPVATEPAAAEARRRYGAGGDGWLPAPDDVVVLDHLPGRPGSGLLEDYAGWFAGVQAWTACARPPDRVGGHEIRPGVWVGLHSRIPADAELVPPCWIGEKVFLGAGVKIGPQAVIEDRSLVEAGAEIARSIVGPETLVGQLTELTDSIAWGDTLVNWRTGSQVQVTDNFLLSSLRGPAAAPATGRPSPWRLPRPWTAPVPFPKMTAAADEN